MTPHTFDREEDEAMWSSFGANAPSNGNGTASGGQRQTPAPDVPLTAAEALRELASRPPERVFSTGIAQLDRLLGGGWRSQMLSLIIGPPGSGKTAYACWTAVGLVASPTTPILYASTELLRGEVAARIYGARADAPYDPVLRGEASPADAAATLDGLGIYIIGADELEETPDPIALIRRKAEAIRAATGQTPIIIVDYLQMLAVQDASQIRLSVGEVARRLRQLAQVLDTAVLACSQSSRAWYGRAARAAKGADEDDDPRDLISAGAEGAGLERAAGVQVWLDVASQPDESGAYPARIRVAKSRRCQVGDAGAIYHGPTGRWWPSPDAVDRMGPAARQAAADTRKSRQAQDLDARVLRTVAEAPEPPTMAQLELKIRGDSRKLRKAVQLLVEAGELIKVDAIRRTGIDRTRTVQAFDLPKPDKHPPAKQPPAPPAAS